MKIKEDGMGWYKITTHRNFKEAAARNLLINHLPTKQFVATLIAGGNSVAAAKRIVDNIKTQAKTPYGVLACRGYILVKGY